MKPTFKRGQAALEFLMTYGWAILAVLVMIGALAYFGILNVGSVTPEKCVVTGLRCVDYRATGASNLLLQVTFENSLGEPITIQSITTQSNGVVSASCLSSPAVAPATATIGPGERFAASCTMNAVSPGVGQKAKMDVEIAYRKAQGGLYDHNITAQITAEVQ